jgi:hypothetical protein
MSIALVLPRLPHKQYIYNHSFKTENVKHSVSIFDNSLREKVFNVLKSGRAMQQKSNLYTSSFITNFHRRYQLKKSEHNNIPPIALKTPPIVRVLHRNQLMEEIDR